MAFIQFLASILGIPAIVVGIVAMLGLLVQRATASDVLKGTLKTTLGFMILQGGAGLISKSLTPFTDMFTKAFNLTGVFPEQNALVAALGPTVGREIALIMVVSFAVNLILARLTPWKYVFLTGHLHWHMAGGMAIVLFSLGLRGAPLVMMGGFITGVTMILFPAILQPYVRRVTGDDNIAFGFFAASWILLCAWIGKLVGNPKRSAEDIEVPPSLDFFRDMAVFLSVVMVVVYEAAALIAGKEVVEKLSGGQNYIVFALIQGLTFTAGLLVLLQGVRMFLADIVPAFQGIANKVVPGARPALDVPVFYPFSPVAATLGFLAAFLGFLLSVVVSQYLFPVVVLPGIGIFFIGAAAGVFGNKLGGRRGTLVSGFLLGLTWPILTALTYPLVDLPAYGVKGLAFPSPDINITIAVIRAVGRLFGM